MTRPLRIEYPGAYYHVMNRGNAGETIFKSKRDKEKFLEYLEKAVERFSLIVHTYCLMDNHYHLLIETPEPNLSVAVQWLNVSYAVYFNRKRKRSGHLFQGRFKAILIDADAYLKQLSRYIHLNPVRAKIADTPADYPWTSYCAFIGNETEPEWLETRFILAQFRGSKKKAIQGYKGFVEGIDVDTLENPNKDLVEGLLLGDSGFITWVKETVLSKKDNDQEIPQLVKLKPKPSMEKIVGVICEQMGCSEEEIREKWRHGNLSREMAIYLARDLSGLSGKELGTYFGGISGPAITRSYKQFNRKLENKATLKRKVKKVKEQILNI